VKLYHWKTQGMDLLVMADSPDSAKAIVAANVNCWRHQDPNRFDQVLKDLESSPYFVAGRGHVVSIDSYKRG
jgi:hypothetical protein